VTRPLPGISNASRAAPVPPGAIGPVAPVGAGRSRAAQPLARSGLDVAAVLATEDVVVPRGGAEPVAVAQALERARAALVTHQPAAMLAALDEAWAGARHTAAGWYLRGGALALLGHVQEGNALAAEGLERWGEAPALRFLQALTRLAAGDVPGARVAVQQALQRAPDTPLLLAAEAVVLARLGQREAAMRGVERVASGVDPDAPVLAFAREAVRAASAASTRARATPLPGGAVAPERPAVVASAATPLVADAPSARGGGADPLREALRRVGAHLGSGMPVGRADAARAARGVLRALSAGGTLVGTVGTAQAHTARLLLAAVLRTLRGASVAGDPALAGLLGRVVPALEAGDLERARALVHRGASTLPPVTVPLLHALVGEPEAPAGGDSSVRGAGGQAHDLLLHMPLRLGLSLLDDAPPAGEGMRGGAPVGADGRGDGGHASRRADTGHVEPGEGWGALLAARIAGRASRAFSASWVALVLLWAAMSAWLGWPTRGAGRPPGSLLAAGLLLVALGLLPLVRIARVPRRGAGAPGRRPPGAR
jgi:hypothetical protein